MWKAGVLSLWDKHILEGTYDSNTPFKVLSKCDESGRRGEEKIKKESDIFSCSCNFLHLDERHSQDVFFFFQAAQWFSYWLKLSQDCILVSLLGKPLLGLIISHSDNDTRADVFETHGCFPWKPPLVPSPKVLRDRLVALLGSRWQLYLLALAGSAVICPLFIEHLLVFALVTCSTFFLLNWYCIV